MKKVLLTLITLAFAGGLMAENFTYTENWPNGKKKMEGSYISAVQINDNDPKDVKAKKMESAIKVGKWTYWHQNGNLSAEQYYTNGSMTGTWKAWYENGNLELEINFTTGNAVIYHMNGKKESEGKMLDGMIKDGMWTIYYDNGNKNVEGAYIKGQKDGVWKYYDRDGKSSATESWKNGALTK